VKKSFHTHSLCLLLLLSVAFFSTLARAEGCPTLPRQLQYSSSVPKSEGFECGINLKNVTISIAEPFRLRAAALHWPVSAQNRLIDLSKEKVSFDSYSKNGGLPHGQMLLSGNVSIRVKLVFDPGESGELEAALPESIGIKGPAKNLLKSLKLSKTHSDKELRVPSKLLSRPSSLKCWTAIATIDLKNIWFTIADSDDAGAYPSQYTLREIHGHRSLKCSN
jgi:hypothetical protein